MEHSGAAYPSGILAPPVSGAYPSMAAPAPETVETLRPLTSLLAAENAQLLAQQAQQAAGTALITALAIVTSTPDGTPDMARLHAELQVASQQQQSAQEFLRQATDSMRGTKTSVETAMHTLVSAQASAAPAYGVPPIYGGSSPAAHAYQPSHAPKRTLDGDAKAAMYKTVLCKGFASTGGCPYGAKCNFAHGQAELRAKPAAAAPPFIPSTSQQYAPPGSYSVAAAPYPYGAPPQPAAVETAAYGRQPQPPSVSGKPPGWRTVLCRRHAAGTCTFGDRCNFAHSVEQLQPKVDEFGRVVPQDRSYSR